MESRNDYNVYNPISKLKNLTTLAEWTKCKISGAVLLLHEKKNMHQFLEKIELGIKHLAFALQIGLNLPVSVAKRYNDSHIGSNTIF